MVRIYKEIWRKKLDEKNKNVLQVRCCVFVLETLPCSGIYFFFFFLLLLFARNNRRVCVCYLRVLDDVDGEWMIKGKIYRHHLFQLSVGCLFCIYMPTSGTFEWIIHSLAYRTESDKWNCLLFRLIVKALSGQITHLSMTFFYGCTRQFVAPPSMTISVDKNFYNISNESSEWLSQSFVRHIHWCC